MQERACENNQVPIIITCNSKLHLHCTQTLKLSNNLCNCLKQCQHYKTKLSLSNTRSY